MKYDDAGWHYGGDFPKELPPEAGATHIGMFVAWAMLNGLASAEFLSEWGDDLVHLSGRKMTPGEWFIRACDEKFVDADLNEEGNAFALQYYGAPQDRMPPYLVDYGDLFDGIDRVYFVSDTWENYDALSPVIAKRFAHWKRSLLPWWKRFFA